MPVDNDAQPDDLGFDDALRAAFRPVDETVRNRARSVAKAVRASTGVRAAEPDPSGTPESETALGGTDRYTIRGEVGRGGVGVVFEGTDRRLDRDVAIKLLHERYASDPDLVRRFVEEAKIGGQLQHPGIVPVHDIGTSEAGRPFFTMKLVRGHTLAALLEARSSASHDVARFYAIFQGLCQTMAFAHARGVIHRDLKPANIMVGDFGEVQVMDWGLAKVIGRGETPVARTEIEDMDDDVARTRVGSVMGTLAYMPPEQARGDVDRIDARADVFALGAILCKILTGAPPYARQPEADVLWLAMHGDLTACHERLDDVEIDAELKDIVRHCLEPDLDRRSRDAGVVAEAFTDYLTTVEARVRTARMAAAKAEARAAAERRARRMTLLASVSVLIAIVVGAGALYWSEQDRRRRSDRVLADIGRAESETNDKLAEAQAADDPATPAWAEAVAAAKRATVLAKSEDVDGAVRERVTRLFGRVTTGEAAAKRVNRQRRKDAEMVQRLEGIRAAAGPFAWRTRNLAYSNALRSYGLDFMQISPADAAQTIDASPIRRSLIDAINDWLPAEAEAETEAAVAVRKRLGAVINIVDPDSGRRRIRDLIAANDFQALVKATKELDPAVESTGTILLASVFLGRRAAYSDAIALLRRTYRVHPHDFWVLLELSRWLKDQQPPQPREALSFMRAAVALRPGIPDVHCAFGHILQLLERYDDAEEAFQNALRLNPQHVQTHVYLASLATHTKGAAAAVEHMRDACRLRPGDTYYRVLLGSYLIDCDAAEAVAVLSDVLRDQPQSPVVHRWLSEAYNEMANHHKAIEHAEEALRLCAEERKRHAEGGSRGFHVAPAVTFARQQLAWAWMSLRQYGRALAALRQIRHLDVSALVARCLSGIGDHEAAAAEMEALLEREPKAMHRWDYGLVLSQAGRYADAVPHLEEAAKTPHELRGVTPGSFIRSVKTRARVARRYRAALSGELVLTGEAERTRFSYYCFLRGLHLTAARTWEAMIAEYGADSLRDCMMWAVAACSAAAAGTGRAREAASLDAQTREGWRDKARRWFERSLALMPDRIPETGSRGRAGWHQLLRLREHIAFAGVRDDEELAELPPAERAAFRALWQRFDRQIEARNKLPK